MANAYSCRGMAAIEMKQKNMQFPHRRFDPLRGRWVLVSPHRTQRPWQGEVSKTEAGPALHYDPLCYLCPGNARAAGKKNPAYTGVFVFDNDYAALLPDSPVITSEGMHPLFRAESERGVCRVLCFHPDHSLTLARMEVAEIVPVVEAWTAQWSELGARREIGYVQIFENRGAMMGASNPHPHCQIWATEHVPDEPAAELANQLDYRTRHGGCLLCDALQAELKQEERLVCENDEFVALVPFWAVWPFETLLLSRASRERHGPIQCRAATGLGRYAQAPDHTLRQPLPDQFPLYDGLSPAARRWQRAPGMALPRAFLSSPPALGHGAEIHGRL